MIGELEQRLLTMGEAIEFPPEPDVVDSVLSRLPPRRAWHARPARRTLAIALAAILLLTGAALAVPATRNAILRVVGLRGVVIERVPRLPSLPADAGRRLGLGTRIPVGGARHAASFTALLPPHPTAVYLDHDIPGGRISALTGPALITEFRATGIPVVLKLIGPGTRVRIVRVNGDPGAWLSGAPHEVAVQTSTGRIHRDRVRLEGNVLIWQRGPVTVRIEGERSLEQALVLARTVH